MKEHTYTFEIYDQETEEVVDVVSVQASNLTGADEEIDQWLQEHPGTCIDPNYNGVTVSE